MKDSIVKFVKEFVQAIPAMVFVILLFQAVLITQDNQDTLNDLSDKLAELQTQVDQSKSKQTSPAIVLRPSNYTKVKKRHSAVWQVEQWLGNHKK